MNNDTEYLPLVDCISAHQNGVLDAVHGRVSLINVLVAAEECVLSNSYRWGYEKGLDLVNKQE